MSSPSHRCCPSSFSTSTASKCSRGRKGTLYGRNTTGGAINFITAKPTFDTNGYVKASYERFDRYELEVAAGGPASDTLAGRIAVKTVQQFDGWQTNALTGEKTGNKNRIIARGQLLWEPSDDFHVLAKAGYAYDKSKQQLREHISVTTPLHSAALIAMPLSKAAAMKPPASISWAIPIRRRNAVRSKPARSTGHSRSRGPTISR